MPDLSQLVAVAEALAGVYERLMADHLPAHVDDAVLDGLFDAIAAIETLLPGGVGPRARAVLGPSGAV